MRKSYAVIIDTNLDQIVAVAVAVAVTLTVCMVVAVAAAVHPVVLVIIHHDIQEYR